MAAMWQEQPAQTMVEPRKRGTWVTGLLLYQPRKDCLSTSMREKTNINFIEAAAYFHFWPNLIKINPSTYSCKGDRFITPNQFMCQKPLSKTGLPPSAWGPASSKGALLLQTEMWVCEGAVGSGAAGQWKPGCRMPAPPATSCCGVARGAGRRMKNHRKAETESKIRTDEKSASTYHNKKIPL